MADKKNRFMEDSFHLTDSLAEEFVNDRLSGSDQSAVKLHLEKCRDCRRLILSVITGTDYFANAASSLQVPESDKRRRFYLEWMHGSGTKIAGGKNVLWP